MTEPVLFDVRDGVARLTLNRPEAANTIDVATAGALLDAANRCGEDGEIRAVVVAGRGAMFCGGGDLKSFAAAGADLPRVLKEVTERLHVAVSRLARLDAPVIAVVQGSAAGAGFSLAASCDLVLAAADARFVPAYNRVGLSPDGSLTWYLPRLVGHRRALDILLTNRTLSSREALDLGIVSEVVAAGELTDRGAALAAELAAGPTRAHGAVKRLLRSTWSATLESHLEDETAELAAMARTADGREGIEAFVAKRAPTFGGR